MSKYGFGILSKFLKFKSKSLSLLHLNICSLSNNVDILCALLKEINMNFDITALTKSRIKNNSASPINIELKNYRHIPTEEAVF